MYRDMVEWQKWHDWHYALALSEFEKAQEKAISEAQEIEDEANRNGMLRTAKKMKFQFDKTKLLNYGKCSRFGKSVSFIPNVCQIETQNCFIHRKDLNINQ